VPEIFGNQPILKESTYATQGFFVYNIPHFNNNNNNEEF